jgi:two-component system, NarL family, nitrate/nitrite response regulator NarL
MSRSLAMSAPVVPRRVVVIAADPAAARRLAALVGRSGHVIVGAAEDADAVLTDGSALPATGAPAAELPTVALGVAEGDFAGLLAPGSGPAQLDAALRAVAAGLTVRSPAIAKPRFGPLPEAPGPLLTSREIEVLAAFGDGLSNKEAARRLGISPHTVKFHSEGLFRKLGAGSRAEAVAKGLRRQIVEF